jgi:hypothetical protein
MKAPAIYEGTTMRSVALGSSAVITAVVAGMSAVAVTPLASLPARHDFLAGHELRLAAAAIPVGAIPAAFLRNQLTFCGLICPSIAQLVTAVPIGAVESPLAFVAALQSGSLLKAVGSAAESVTAPADAATAGIITPDVFIVVPKAFKALDVTVVQAINIVAAVLVPGSLVPAVQTARAEILNALDQPATRPPSDLPTGAQGLVEVAAVEGINVVSAVAFQAGELVLAGAVHVANVTATELASTGNVGAALGAGASATNAVVNQAGGIVTAAVDTAVTSVGKALHDTSPTTPATTPPPASTRTTVNVVVAQSKHSAPSVPRRPLAAMVKSAVEKLTKPTTGADAVKTDRLTQSRHRAPKSATGSRERR